MGHLALEVDDGGVAYATADLRPALDSLDDAANYADWIVEQIAPFLSGQILEIGAGTGTMSERLRVHGDLTATEPDDGFARRLHHRFEGTDVVVRCGDIASETKPGAFDSVVLINVLEHIEDDAEALAQLYASLRPSGYAAIFVPAFPLLLSSFDRSIGHFRRYRKDHLRRMMEEAGFSIQRANYMNLPGWFAWLILARILRRPPAVGRKVVAYDRVVIPIVRRVEQRFRPPFGQSLFCVGQKPVVEKESDN